MNYYNENDQEAAAWLRELIRDGSIPAGDVDERSIVDVKPHELTPYTQQHFFAGIGGWALALRLAGWPEDKPVRTGSCPCQPFSQTGKRLGTRDSRHLWPVFRDLITFGEATVTFGEQVASPLGREWLARVRADLEGLGYEVGAADLCAAGVGAPHIRQRLYWVANSQGKGRRTGAVLYQKHKTGHARTCDGSEVGALGCEHESATGIGGVADSDGRQSCNSGIQRGRKHGQQSEDGGITGRMGDSDGKGSQGRNERILECGYQWPPGTANLVVCCEDGKARRFEPGSFPLAHGVSNRVGLLRGYGNAIVPQLAAEFIKAAKDSFR